MKIPENGVTTMRVMTRKSKIGFGKWRDFTVADIMILDKSYIVWMYYSMANISLHDDILQELGMEPATKPGVDDEKFHAWLKREGEKFTFEERMHGVWAKKRIREKKAKAKAWADAKAASLTKGQLQAVNHGRMWINVNGK